MASSWIASRPLVLAHRGGAALRPENTIAAFDHGAALGADGFECDVHLSLDGEPVVIHDATLDRTTDATGPVAARTAASCRTWTRCHRFGEAHGAPFRGLGFGMPRLREVLTPLTSACFVLELKGADPAVGVAAVRSRARSARCPRVLRRLRGRRGGRGATPWRERDDERRD